MGEEMRTWGDTELGGDRACETLQILVRMGASSELKQKNKGINRQKYFKIALYHVKCSAFY